MRSGAECIGDDARTVICVYKAEYVKADTQIETAGFQVEIIPTPGHTEADAVIISEKNMYCSAEIPFFIILIGRTDLLREAEVSLSVR